MPKPDTRGPVEAWAHISEDGEITAAFVGAPQIGERKCMIVPLDQWEAIVDALAEYVNSGHSDMDPENKRVTWVDVQVDRDHHTVDAPALLHSITGGGDDER